MCEVTMSVGLAMSLKINSLMASRVTIAALLLVFSYTTAVVEIPWVASDHTAFLDAVSASSSTHRNLATKEHESVGPVCAITGRGSKVLCWWTAGMSSDSRERSAVFTLPRCLNATRFVSVRVHMDLWALTDSGHLVMWLRAGAMGTAPGYPMWPVDSNALRAMPTGDVTIGVFLGPWLDFWVHHDIAASPSSDTNSGPRDWRRDVCALGGDGEVVCWVVMAGTSTTLASLSGAVYAGSTCGWYDMTRHRDPSARPITCPTASASACSSSGQGPFVGMSWFPATYDGLWRGRPGAGAAGTWSTGLNRWMGAFLHGQGRTTYPAGAESLIPTRCFTSGKQQLASLEPNPFWTGGAVIPLSAEASYGSDSTNREGGSMMLYVDSSDMVQEAWQWRKGVWPSCGHFGHTKKRSGINTKLASRWNAIAVGYHGLVCGLWGSSASLRCFSAKNEYSADNFLAFNGANSALSAGAWLGAWGGPALGVNGTSLSGGWGGMCVLNGEARPYCAMTDGDSLPRTDAFPSPPSFAIVLVAATRATNMDSFCVQVLATDGALISASATASLPASSAYTLVQCYGQQSFVQTMNPFGHPIAPTLAVPATLAGVFNAGPADVCFSRSGSTACWGSYGATARYTILDVPTTLFPSVNLTNGTIFFPATIVPPVITTLAAAVAPSFQCGIVNVSYGCEEVQCISALRTNMAICLNTSNIADPWVSIVPGNTTKVSAVVAGTGFACFLLTSGGSLTCVGDNVTAISALRASALGLGATTLSIGVGWGRMTVAGTWSRLTTGTSHLCGYHSAKADFACLSTTGQTIYPGKASFGGTAPASIAIGTSHGCALSATGVVSCFGDDRGGVVTGASSFSAERFSAVMPMRNTTCGVTVTGFIRCWGALSRTMFTEDYNITSRSELASPIPGMAKFFSVGQAGASDATCGTTGVCATLVAAIAAASALPIHSRPVEIIVYGSIVSPPVVLPPSALGLRIRAAPQGAASITFTGVSANSVLIDVQAGSVALIGLSITSDSGMCSEAVRVSGGRVWMQGLVFSNLACTTAVLRLWGPSDLAARAYSVYTRPTTVDARVESSTFSNSSAPNVVRVDRGFPRISIWNTTANSPKGVTYAGRFIGLFHAPTSASILHVADVSVSGFACTDAVGGGVIYSGGNGLIELTRVQAVNVSATQGALLSAPSSAYSLLMTSVTCINCTAANNGGAVFFIAAQSVHSSVKVSNSTFTGCAAGGAGGALYLSSNDWAFMGADMLTISGSSFTNCNAGADGGAIYVLGAGNLPDAVTLTFLNNKFTGTAAAADGGALSIVTSTLNIATVVLSDCSFDASYAGGKGGAVMIRTPLKVIMARVSMTNVQAIQAGGGLWTSVKVNCGQPSDCSDTYYRSRGLLTITTSTFNSCRCTGLLCPGGCFFVDAARAILTSVTADDGFANAGGCGYISALFSGVDSSSFTSCSATTDGGALAMQQGTETNVTSSNIADCYAGRGGGVMVGTDFMRSGYGGLGTPSGRDPEMSILSSKFTRIRSDTDGGGLAFVNTASSTTGYVTIRVQNSQFDACTAKKSGGGLVADMGGAALFATQLSITSVNWANCTANEGGGAAFVGSVTARRTTIAALLRSNFTSCTARVDGGAVSSRFVSCIFEQSVLRNNSAGLGGGAIIARGSSVDLRNIMLSDNSAVMGVGGSIAALACTGTGLTSSRLPTAIGVRGSDYSQWLPAPGAEHLVVGTIFMRNVAYADGGAVYVQGCLTDLAFVTFVDNVAGASGGAIASAFASDETSVRVRYSVVVGNEARGTDGGGGVCLRSASGYQPVCSPAAGYSATADARAVDAWRAVAAAWALTTSTRMSDSASLLKWLPVQQLRPDVAAAFQWTETRSPPLHSCACSAQVWTHNASWTVSAITPALAAGTAALVGCSATTTCCIITGRLGTGVPATAAIRVRFALVGTPTVTRTCDCNTITGSTGYTNASGTAADMSAHWPYPRLSLLRNVTQCDSRLEDAAALAPVNNTPTLLSNGSCTGGLSAASCACMSGLCSLLPSLQKWWIGMSGGGYPWMVDKQLSCLFMGNTAMRGGGADLLVTPAAGFKAYSGMFDAWLWGGKSSVKGGSVTLDGVAGVEIARLVLNGSVASGIRSSAGVLTSPGLGGGVFIAAADALSISNVSIVNAVAHKGGALYLQRRVAGFKDDKQVLQYPDADVVLLTALSIINNTALFGGGSTYVDLGTVPACTECDVRGNTGQLWGNDTATSVRRIVILSAPYQSMYRLSDGDVVPASSVIGGIAVEQPLLILQLADAFNNTVVADNETICDITATKNGTTAVLPLSYDARYVALNGIVRIFPFAVSIGPGAYGRISVSCTVDTSRALPPVSIDLVTEVVRTVWLPATLARPQLVLSSTIGRPRYVDTPLGVEMVDASGLPISTVSVSCGITVESAVQGDGTVTGASIMGVTSAYTVAGIAYFRPAVQADSNVTVRLSAFCTWISGDLVSAEKLLSLRTYPLAILIGSPGSNYSFAGSALLPHLLGSEDLLPTARVTTLTALPSSTDPATMQALQPPLWISVLSVHPTDGLQRITDVSVSCTIGTASDWAVLNAAAILIAGNTSLSSGTTNSSPSDASYGPFKVVPDPFLQGTLSTITVDGVALFSRVGIRAAPFRAYVPLQVSCSWSTGELLRSPHIVTLTGSLRAMFVVPPPVWLLPSGLSTSAVIAMTPPPVVLVYQAGAGPNGTESLLLGHALPCLANLVTVATNITSTGLRPSLIGTTDTVMSTSSGEVTFSRLGVTGSFSSVVRLVVTCTWISGLEVSVTSDLIRLASMRMTLLAEPPPQLLPTNPSSVSPIDPQPRVVMEVDDPSQITGGANGSQWVPLQSYSLTVTVGLVTPIQDYGISPSSLLLQGDTVTTTSLDGEATFPRIAVAGPFGAKFSLAFASAWLSGQPLSTNSGDKRFPFVWLTWGASSSATYSDRPPRYTLYNTPITPVGVTLSYSPTGPPGGIADPGGSSAVALTAWAEAGTVPTDFRCSIDAVAGSPPLPVVVTGTSTTTPSVNGSVVFGSLSLLPPLGSEGLAVRLRVACTLRGLALPSIEADTILQRLTLAWDSPPPATTLPSSQSENSPFVPAVRIVLLNQTNGVLSEESGTTCTVTVTAAAFSPATDVTQRRALLLGNTRAVILEGYATFPGLAISAPYGSSVNITAACTRPQGGVIQSLDANIVIDSIQVTWDQTPSRAVLYNTPVSLSVHVTRFQADESNEWEAKAGTLRREAGIRCSLRVDTAAEFLYAGIPLIKLNSGDSDAESVTNVNGTAFFRLAVTGQHNVSALVYVTCARADQVVTSNPVRVLLERVSLSFVTPPPAVWLPSSGVAKTAVNPPPTIILRRPSGDSQVDARGAICRVGIEPASIAAIQEPPLEGYTLSLLQAGLILPDGVTLEASSASASAQENPSITALAMSTPMRLSDIYIRAPFGAHLNLTVICTRSQGDTSDTLRWPLRMTDNAVRYTEQAPAATVSQRAFRLAVEVYDAGMTAEGGQGTGPVVFLDNSTTCFISVTTADAAIVIQNADASSALGVVTFRGVALTARVGSKVDGLLSCRLGQMPYASELQFSVGMEPCEIGTAPSGVQGYECGVCGANTYSDGGTDAACIACPRGGVGVECTGGRLRLLPGFYRADRQDTITATSEFHLCYNEEACVLNVGVNRSAAQTHSCLQGYAGPLCGVCDAKADYASIGNKCSPCWDRQASLAVLALMPIAIFAVVFYIAAVRRQTKSAPSQALLRIFLTWLSTIGTLGSLYVAKGTQLFREIFGFSDIVGASPLTIPPVQCQLRLSYFTRYGITALLPILMALASVFVAVCVILHLETRRCTGKLRSSLALRAPAWAGGGKRKHADGSGTGVKPVGTPLYVTVSSTSSFARAAVAVDNTTANPMVQALQAQQAPQIKPARTRSFGTRRLGLYDDLRDSARSCCIRVDYRVLTYFRSQAWISPAVFILNISYASITNASFSVFNCLPYTIGGITYLSQDVAVECYTTEHTAWRIVAGLVILSAVAGVPLWFAFLLRRSREHLRTASFFMRYGFFYDGYALNRGLEGWESLVLARKALIVLIGSLIKDSVYQIAAAIVLLVTCLFLHATYQPFEQPWLNSVESASLITIILTQLISLFYLRFDIIAAPCLGVDLNTVVDTQGTTCAMILSKRGLNDGMTTGLLVVLNFTFAGVLLRLLARECMRAGKDTRAGLLMRNISRKVHGKVMLDPDHVRRRVRLAAKRSGSFRGHAAVLDPLRDNHSDSEEDEEDAIRAGRLPESMAVPSIGTLRAPRAKVRVDYDSGHQSGLSPVSSAGARRSFRMRRTSEGEIVLNTRDGAPVDPALLDRLARRTFDPLGLDLSQQVQAGKEEREMRRVAKSDRQVAMQELDKLGGELKHGLTARDVLAGKSVRLMRGVPATSANSDRTLSNMLGSLSWSNAIFGGTKKEEEKHGRRGSLQGVSDAWGEGEAETEEEFRAALWAHASGTPSASPSHDNSLSEGTGLEPRRQATSFGANPMHRSILQKMAGGPGSGRIIAAPESARHSTSPWAGHSRSRRSVHSLMQKMHRTTPAPTSAAAVDSEGGIPDNEEGWSDNEDATDDAVEKEAEEKEVEDKYEDWAAASIGEEDDEGWGSSDSDGEQQQQQPTSS